MTSRCIMIIAGEASGDMHGAKLVQSIKKRADDAFFFGIGGQAMHAEGVRLIVDAETLSVVGLTEVIHKIPEIFRALRTVKRALQRLKPDLLILIDFPDFNFFAASAAKKIGIPVLYYISPQIWAWRRNRVKKIKRLVDHMAVILPFEAAFYREHRVPVSFVGHPLLDSIRSAPKRQSEISDDQAPIIGLLPGSREKEVSTLLPPMLEAAGKIQRRACGIKFLVSRSPSVREDLFLDIVNRYGSGVDLEIREGSVETIFKQSRLLVAASGTVTLEAALHGVPMVIVYKVSPLSYWLGKRLIKVKHIGIVNLIVQKTLLPELIQDDASPDAISETVLQLLDDSQKLKYMEEELLRVRNLLGGSGASDRVAKIALNLI